MSGCGVHIVRSKSAYQQGPVSVEVNKPFDDVWSSAIALVEKKEIIVRGTDKSSGLVIVDVPTFKGKITSETSAGELMNPEAFIVIDQTLNNYPGQEKKRDAKAICNLTFTKKSDGVTKITADLHTIEIQKSSVSLKGKSTGNYEKWLLSKFQ